MRCVCAAERCTCCRVCRRETQKRRKQTKHKTQYGQHPERLVCVSDVLTCLSLEATHSCPFPVLAAYCQETLAFLRSTWHVRSSCLRRIRSYITHFDTELAI